MDHEKLHNLLLTSDNWELLEELERLLSVCGLWFVVTGMLSLHKSQIFTEVTRTMSMARTPTLPWALTMYEHMRVELVDAIDLTNEPTIKAAAQAGLTKLMQYYDKALQNESNIVATGEWFDMQHVLELNNIQRAILLCASAGSAAFKMSTRPGQLLSSRRCMLVKRQQCQPQRMCPLVQQLLRSLGVSCPDSHQLLRLRPMTSLLSSQRCNNGGQVKVGREIQTSLLSGGR